MAQPINKNITHILIDVHGVLTKGDEGQKFSLFLKNNFNIDPAKQTFFWRSYVDKLDRIKSFPKEYIKLFNQKFNVSFTPDKYYDLIIKNITLNTELLRYLSKISDKYKVIIVSDNSSKLANKLGKVLKKGFSKYTKFYSYEYGLTKKDGLLSIVINDQNLIPQNCLFVDDSQVNIDTGNQLGLNSIQFKNNQDLFIQIEKFLS